MLKDFTRIGSRVLDRIGSVGKRLQLMQRGTYWSRLLRQTGAPLDINPRRTSRARIVRTNRRERCVSVATFASVGGSPAASIQLHAFTTLHRFRRATRLRVND